MSDSYQELKRLSDVLESLKQQGKTHTDEYEKISDAWQSVANEVAVLTILNNQSQED